MKELSRRQFLKNLGVGAAVCASIPVAKACESITPPVHKKTPYPALSRITDWYDKDFYEIVSDLAYVVTDLQKNSKGNFFPCRDKFILGIPESFAPNLGKVNCYGRSVSAFIKGAWPNSTVDFTAGSYMYASVTIGDRTQGAYFPCA